MFKNIKYMVVDVDGTMTDAGIYYDEYGNELKKFCTKDAAGFFVARKVGIKIIVLTGRECKATQRRMRELKVDFLFQNIKNKVDYLKQFIEKYKIQKEEIAYIGDDLNDLFAMKLAGFVACPKDSCTEVKEISHYVSRVRGGYGAVRDIIEFVLKERQEWEQGIIDVYDIGI